MERLRQSNINTIPYWDEQHSKREPESPERFEFVAGLIKARSEALGRKLKVLDIGCADGTAFGIIKGIVDVDYTGTDFSPVAIDRAREQFTAPFYVADVLEQPFRDHYFDIVLCQEVFEHVDDPAALAKEIERVMDPNGAAIISTPRGEHLNTIKEHVWSYQNQDIRNLFPNRIVEFSASRWPNLIIALID
jgi:SAM-dependent methyltransferase